MGPVGAQLLRSGCPVHRQVLTNPRGCRQGGEEGIGCKRDASALLGKRLGRWRALAQISIVGYSRTVVVVVDLC